ncbi:hypothetical protein QN239_12525 [Mycolicibacterium sp. Y3]
MGIVAMIAAGGVVKSGARLVAGAGVLGALVAMAQPLTLSAVDYGGVQITCGTGYVPDISVAARLDRINVDQHNLATSRLIVTDYVGQCQQVVHCRWGASAAAGVVGLGVMAAMAAASVKRSWRYFKLGGPGDEAPTRRSGGLSAADLLRREGRL